MTLGILREENREVLSGRGGGRVVHLGGGEDNPGETGGEDHVGLGVRGDRRVHQRVEGDDDPWETREKNMKLSDVMVNQSTVLVVKMTQG